MSVTSRPGRGYDPFKRLLDFVAALALLVLTLPLQATTAIVVWATLGRPVFFRQARPGLAGRPFILIKFRTMHNVVDGRRSDAERLTRVGRVLRSMSLDELPSLYNVLVGEMSLVGPRPLLIEYLERYSPHQARRHEVRPGITGLAQVNGRNSITWEEKFDWDVRYVDQRSLSVDVVILLRTVLTVFHRSGIAAEGHATAHEFTGTPRDARENQGDR